MVTMVTSQQSVISRYIDVKRFTTDDEYHAGLEELMSLAKSRKGTPEFNRLLSIAALVHEYEENNFPM